jgi:hypothetical protein
MFCQSTLAIVVSLARLIMLFAIVIEPSVYFFIEYFASVNTQPETNFVGANTYLAHVNIVAFVAGYALHLVSSAQKVARELEEDHNLTI